MRKLIFIIAFALPAFGAITNLRQTGATPKEIIVQFTSPIATACVPEVAESPSYTPLVHDVDPTLFAGSNSDFRNGAQGRERTLIIGSAAISSWRRFRRIPAASQEPTAAHGFLYQ